MWYSWIKATDNKWLDNTKWLEQGRESKYMCIYVKPSTQIWNRRLAYRKLEEESQGRLMKARLGFFVDKGLIWHQGLRRRQTNGKLRSSVSRMETKDEVTLDCLRISNRNQLIFRQKKNGSNMSPSKSSMSETWCSKKSYVQINSKLGRV